MPCICLGVHFISPHSLLRVFLRVTLIRRPVHRLAAAAAAADAIADDNDDDDVMK